MLKQPAVRLSQPARPDNLEGRAAVTAATTAATSAETPALHAWPMLRTGTGIIGAGVLAVVLSSDHVLASPGWFTLFSLYNVLAFGGVALLWLRLRPSSRVGVLLLGCEAALGLPEVDW